MVDFHFELAYDGEPPNEYAPGHVTIATGYGTGTSKPDHYFMLAISLVMLLDEVRVFLKHGKMSGCHWNVIDTSFSVDFERVTKGLKGQKKPIRIVCGGLDLGAVYEAELVLALADGISRFLWTYAGQLGDDEADLVRALKDFAVAFDLAEGGGV